MKNTLYIFTSYTQYNIQFSIYSKIYLKISIYMAIIGRRINLKYIRKEKFYY